MGRDRPGRATAVIGFCLAAGAGTRLEPLTRATPKPLLAPAGRPLIDLAVEALQRAGATRVVVNAHHGADQLVGHLAGRAGVEVVVEPVLLGTGGGLINAAHLGLLGTGDDPVLVTAADHVLDPADLTDLAELLERSGAPMVAGLVPATTDPFGLRLEGTAAEPPASHVPGEWSGPGKWSGPGEGSPPAGGRVVRDPAGPWDSAGAYALRAGLLCDLEPGPATLSGRVLGPLLDRGRLAGLPFRGQVADAGTLARLLDVSAGLLAGRWPYELPPGQLGRAVGSGPVFVAEGAQVDPAAVLAGPVVLDTGARVGVGAVVTRSVVGPGAVVGPSARVSGSFLGPGAHLPTGAAAVAALLPGPPRHPVTPGHGAVDGLLPAPHCHGAAPQARATERGVDPLRWRCWLLGSVTEHLFV
ncbi:MAG TPA: NDP-sugar synthase [Actinomycetes bacterium]|nr:NDP-sugar synthase [Actinomycetes bacterium]